MPRHFHRMVLAEMRKVFTRGSGIAALVIALLVGLGAVGVMAWVKSMGEGGPSMNGTPISQLMAISGVEAAGMALTGRNFYVLPLFLLLATASSVGGEISDRTLRELVVRPVSRWSALLAKLVALCSLSLTTLLLTLVPSLALGSLMFGLQAEGTEAHTVLPLLGGYASSFLTDLGLLVLTMAASLVIPSVGGTVVGTALLLLVDMGIRAVLWMLEKFGVDWAPTALAFTIGRALGCWEGWKDGWNPVQFGALAAYIVVCGVFAVVQFRRMDVP